MALRGALVVAEVPGSGASIGIKNAVRHGGSTRRRKHYTILTQRASGASIGLAQLRMARPRKRCCAPHVNQGAAPCPTENKTSRFIVNWEAPFTTASAGRPERRSEKTGANQHAAAPCIKERPLMQTKRADGSETIGSLKMAYLPIRPWVRPLLCDASSPPRQRGQHQRARA